MKGASELLTLVDESRCTSFDWPGWTAPDEAWGKEISSSILMSLHKPLRKIETSSRSEVPASFTPHYYTVTCTLPLALFKHLANLIDLHAKHCRRGAGHTPLQPMMGS